MIRILLFILFGFPFVALSQQWRDLNGGVDGIVHAMYVDSINNELYVGGTFQHAGGNFSSCIAKWDSVQWTSIGNDTIKGHPDVRCIVKFNGDIIVGGYFDSIGMVRMNNIARWDGVRWNPMGYGFSRAVTCLLEYNGELYAGGSFEYSGNDTILHIAKWNGNNWVNLPGNAALGNDVETMTQFNSLLIIGGDFSSVSSLPNSSRVIAFDGQNWSSMNSPFNNFIFALEVYQDTLYAAGMFTAYPGASSNYISKFDGQNWQAVPYPTGGTNWITDITNYHNRLVVCGYFTNPNDIGVFNGAGYDSIGSAAGYIYRTCVFKNELYVGGGFVQVGNMSSSSVGRYNDFQINYTPANFVDHCINVFPNPNRNNIINIESDILPADQICITVNNILGQTIKVNKIFGKYYLPYTSSGLYFINIYFKNNFIKTVKLIIE